jgi:hypothetical protein
LIEEVGDHPFVHEVVQQHREIAHSFDGEVRIGTWLEIDPV